MHLLLGQPEPFAPNSGEASLRRRAADQSPPEVYLGICCRDADGSTTEVRAAARGVVSIVAHARVLVVLIVVAGIVAVTAMVTRAHGQDALHQGARQ